MNGRRSARLALLAAAWSLAACAPVGPVATGPVGSTTPGPASATPGADAGLRGSDVPPIDPDTDPTEDGTSAGATAMLVDSAAGRVTLVAGATCTWVYQGEGPVLVSVLGEPVSLYGEWVRAAVREGQPTIEREWAPYVVLDGGTTDLPREEDGAWLVRATRLRASVSMPPPGGVPLAMWRRPIGDDPAALIVRVLEIGWRCAPAPPEPTPPEPTPEPEPEPDPTPVCPPPVAVDPPPFPRTTLSVGGQSVVGEPASVTLQSCTLTGSDQSPWMAPATGIAAAAGVPLLFRVDSPGVELVAVSAQAGRAEVGAGASMALEVRGDPRTGSVIVVAPPAGDWSVSVSVVLNDRVHGAVWSAPVYFRVRVGG